MTDISNPIVKYVDPPSGTGFNPGKDLFIEIRFSSPVHNKDGKLITRDNGYSELVNNIYLQKVEDNAHPIIAKAISVPSRNPIPDDYTRWLFTFTHGMLNLF